MYKKYTTPCPPVGCGEVERHLEMAQPKKDLRVFNLGSFVIQRCLFCSLLKNKNFMGTFRLDVPIEVTKLKK